MPIISLSINAMISCTMVYQALCSEHFIVGIVLLARALKVNQQGNYFYTWYVSKTIQLVSLNKSSQHFFLLLYPLSSKSRNSLILCLFLMLWRFFKFIVWDFFVERSEPSVYAVHLVTGLLTLQQSPVCKDCDVENSRWQTALICRLLVALAFG